MGKGKRVSGSFRTRRWKSGSSRPWQNFSIFFQVSTNANYRDEQMLEEFVLAARNLVIDTPPPGKWVNETEQLPHCWENPMLHILVATPSF